MRDLLDREYTSIAEVAAGLGKVEAYCLGRADRRSVFTTAYLQITRAVEAAVARGRFEDGPWVTRYLIAFGNLYRIALLDWECGDRTRVPKAWRIAFEEAAAGTGLITQHLLLGINAHINHDLALALVGVGIDPQRQRRYRDHTAVNQVLAESTEELKERVAGLYSPLLRRLDRLGGKLDDAATGFSIDHAREHAWTFATALAAASPPAERAMLARALDEQAAVVARLVIARGTRNPILLSAVRGADRADALARRVGGLFRR